MRNKLSVKRYAKTSAKEGLYIRSKLNKSNQFGLDRFEASRLGIQSGVERAKQIMIKDSYDWDNLQDKQSLKSMSNFYNRFKNCRTPKCEGSMLLWGGRQWLRNDLVPFVKKQSKRMKI